MQSNNMNAAQLARLQQQMAAQYGGRGQQQPMMGNAMGGMGNPQQQQQMQQAYMQQQQFQQNQQGMQMRRNSSLGLGNSALVMMQQQQQVAAAGNSQMANAQMSSYLNQLNQNGGGTMDASSASSAQLAALAGMNVNNNASSMGQNTAAALLGNRSQSQQQQPQQVGQSNQMGQGGGMGQTTDANLLQQQIAQLQRQLQQQQQQPNQGMGGMQGNMNARRDSSSSNFNMSNPQQLFHQMQMGNGSSSDMQQQPQPGMSGMNQNQSQNKMNDQFGGMAAMMGGGNQSAQQMQMQQNLRNSGSAQSMMAAQQRGSMNEQELLMQQQQILRSSGMSQQMGLDGAKAQDMFGGMSQNSNNANNSNSNNSNNNQSDLMGQRRSSGLDGMNSGFDMDGSVSSQPSASRPTPMDGSGHGVDTSAAGGQKSFLDGSFAGGWQSNADLPDRRRIIFSILEVIRQMRPDTNKISQKLPHMAKSLEEHLYRSAQTKEEYLDPATLKKRLQLIAHGLELHRTNSSGSMQSSGSSNNNQRQGNDAQLQQFLLQQGNSNNNTMGQNQSGMNMGMNNSMNNMGGNQNSGNANMPQMDFLGGSMSGGMDMSQSSAGMMASGGGSAIGGNQQDRAAQTRKVIRQQQTRLLLLRHASKCKEGPNCKNKFCAQMMILWKHMKKCRDKNCKTPHCLSSRCVLNHYRICKSQGRTSTCEVCGPVMEQIKRQDQGEGMDNSDPLAARPDPELPNNAGMMSQMSSFGQGGGGGGNQNNVQAMQQIQQLYQQQQQAINQNEHGGTGSNDQNDLSSMGGAMQSNPMDNGNPQGNESAQSKIEQHQRMLRQLEKQQQQLLDQQRQLLEQQANVTDQAQVSQLQQQHALLQQLQQRCEQQQSSTQKELMLQMSKIAQGGQNAAVVTDGSQQMGNNSQGSHHSNRSNQSQNQMQQMNMNETGNNLSNQMNQNSMNQDQESLMQSMMNPSQNAMPNQDVSAGSPGGDQESPDQSQSAPADSGATALDDITQSASQTMGNDSEKSSGSKSQTPTPNRPTPAGGRGKGARGRGGKGKRLKDMADDLETAGASIRSNAETSLNKRKGDFDTDSEPANKSARPDGDGSADKADSSSLTSSMPKGDVEQHLLLLHKGLHLTSRTITYKCLPIVQQLIADPCGWVFRDAVDPVVFNLPDYFEVVKNPMHLLLVKKKLENAVYTDMASFERDVKLVFENAILYNGEESEVGQLAQKMMGVFETEYKKVCEELMKVTPTVENKACKLCGAGRKQFEPPVLYCIGGECGMQRIKRNSTYYTIGSMQNCWCTKCYAKLKETEVLMLDDGSETKKGRLIQAVHDSNPEETWVQCVDCGTNVHQICALYNDRMESIGSKFSCPKCVLKNRDYRKPEPTLSLNASSLLKCEMSTFMERGLAKSLEQAYYAKAKELGVPIDDVDKATGLSIRVLSHIEKKHRVRDEMYLRYKKIGCPSDFPVHTKCLGLFQSIGGVDVLLFAMYVYEYGQECPAPNRRRVYISYLDSVQFFEPKMFRTQAYQSMIVEYLRFVKGRGFHTAHIWSCPPAPGDEYVFYCHPPHQKVPQEDKLREWYINLLEEAKKDGVVLETSNFYDEYFASNGGNAPLGSATYPTALPYFEGDYMPGEIETLLAGLTKEEKRKDPPPTLGGQRRTGSKRGTRSNSGISQSQDKIMVRLGNIIHNMKDNLMIARLRSKKFVAAVERGDDVSCWPDDDDTPLVQGKDSSILFPQPTPKEGPVAKDKSGTDQDEASATLRRSLALVGNTRDSDPQFENEMFENRQLFLNYCQSNHCQFDDMRRAKHSTMLVLFQMHNPSVPKFFQQCGVCFRDIAYGNRYHCNICAKFDLCQQCYHPVSTGAWSKRGSRYCHDTSHSFTRISVQDSTEAKKSAEEREKGIRGYLDVLTHAATCDGPPACKLKNCEKMKKLFVHVKTCSAGHEQGCKVCARLIALIIVHARMCTVRGSCTLPFCDRIRERNERLRRQQQFMDDRRRQAQNQFYS